jgi:lipopolysaccharide export system permease protein
MKTIHKSILKELLLTFLLGLIAFNFILMTEKVLRLTKLLASVGASLGDMLRIILYLQPQITVLTTPMAFLIAVLLIYGRLNADNEIVVLRASGMSFKAISKPVFIFGTGCFLLSIVFSFYAGPLGAGKLRQTVSEVITQRAPFAIEEGIFNTTFRNFVIYVKEKPSRDTLSGVFIYDGRKRRQPTVLYAKEGRISGTDGYHISFDLTDGHLHLVREETSTDLSFGRYNLLIPITIEKPARKYNELTPPSLLKKAKTANKHDRVRILLEFWRRLTLPVLCIILMFFAPPLALKAGRTGRLGGLTMGLSVFMAYYMALVYAENLVRSGKIPHYLGAWTPAVVLGIIALWMFRKANSR